MNPRILGVSGYIAMFLAIFSTPAHAITEIQAKTCNTASELAGSTQKAMLSGVSRQRALELFQANTGNASINTKNLMLTVINKVYELQLNDRSPTEIEAIFYRACMKN